MSKYLLRYIDIPLVELSEKDKRNFEKYADQLLDNNMEGYTLHSWKIGEELKVTSKKSYLPAQRLYFVFEKK